jgi:hypothetical protein
MTKPDKSLFESMIFDSSSKKGLGSDTRCSLLGDFYSLSKSFCKKKLTDPAGPNFLPDEQNFDCELAGKISPTKNSESKSHHPIEQQKALGKNSDSSQGDGETAAEFLKNLESQIFGDLDDEALRPSTKKNVTSRRKSFVGQKIDDAVGWVKGRFMEGLSKRKHSPQALSPTKSHAIPDPRMIQESFWSPNDKTPQNIFNRRSLTPDIASNGKNLGGVEQIHALLDSENSENLGNPIANDQSTKISASEEPKNAKSESSKSQKSPEK